MKETTTEKIGKLLAAAEGAATPEEAEAFFAKAQSLASVHSISLATARMAAIAANKSVAEEPTHKRVVIGEKRGRNNTPMINLIEAIARANDTEVGIAHNSTWVNLYGMPSDIATVETLWGAVAVQMTRFAEEWLRTDEWRGETVWRNAKRYVKYDQPQYRDTYYDYRRVEGYWEDDWGHHPITKQAARRSFMDGFISVVGRRLREARVEAVKAAEAAEVHFHQDQAAEAAEAVTGPSSTSLALVDKQAAVTSYFRKRVGKGHWSGSTPSGRSSAATGAGRAAGSRANLGGNRAVGGGGKGIAR